MFSPLSFLPVAPCIPSISFTKLTLIHAFCPLPPTESSCYSPPISPLVLTLVSPILHFFPLSTLKGTIDLRILYCPCTFPLFVGMPVFFSGIVLSFFPLFTDLIFLRSESFSHLPPVDHAKALFRHGRFTTLYPTFSFPGLTPLVPLLPEVFRLFSHVVTQSPALPLFN